MLNPFFNAPSLPSLDINGDHRAAVLRAAQERAALRQSQLEAQSSPMMSPQERIRLWEDLHGLRLPRAVGHKLLRVIADDTALTLRQLQDEQLRRDGALNAEPGA